MVYMVGLFVGSYIVGWLSDRIGRKVVMKSFVISFFYCYSFAINKNTIYQDVYVYVAF